MEEANLAIEYGADAIGLVGEMPTGPGVIDIDDIGLIASTVPSHIQTFLLTSYQSGVDIINQYEKAGTDLIQLVDCLPINQIDLIRKAIPHVQLVQVIHVRDPNSIIEAEKIAPFVDYILLDSGNPGAKIKTLGGTGKVHNWEISSSIVKSVHKPVFLAGGIHAENVVEAIGKVNPFGIDLCSGLRTEGKLDRIKLSRFMKIVKGV